MYSEQPAFVKKKFKCGQHSAFFRISHDVFSNMSTPNSASDKQYNVPLNRYYCKQQMCFLQIVTL